MIWIRCEDVLPEDGQRVLIWIVDPNCYTRNQPVHINCADFEQGNVLGPHPTLIHNCDQYGNNLRPYCWTTGPMRWNGQDVSHWMPLPAKPLDVTQPDEGLQERLARELSELKTRRNL